MNVILSIKPEYIQKILEGRKKYEFRKTKFRKEIDEVFVYATKPIQKIVFKFRVGEIIVDTPENLWENLKDFSGLTEQEFFSYFRNKNEGIAIEIKEIQKFAPPINLSDIAPVSIPPQSWIYIPNGRKMF